MIKMNQFDKNCQKNIVLGGNQSVWSDTLDCVLLKNRNTKYVAPLNVLDSQPTVKHPLSHLQNQQSQSLTSASSLSGNSTTSNSLNSQTASSLENLPKKFVSSMRTLFDIMDDKRTGFVRLVDIEARWQDDGSKGLPHGVIDCLRRVTPVSGMLSFERFCAGLKICLLRNQANECELGRRISNDKHINNNNNKFITVMNQSETTINTNNTIKKNNTNNRNHINNNNQNNNDEKIILNKYIPLSFDNDKCDTNKIHYMKNSHIQEDKKTARIYKRSSLATQRTLSLPKLSPSSDGDSSSEPCVMPIVPSVFAPPKPPRMALMLNNDATNDSKDRFDKAEIRNALQNWQMNVLMNEWEAKDKRRAMAIPNSIFVNRGTADGSSNTMINQKVPLQTQITAQQPQQNPNSMTFAIQKPTQAIYPTNRSPTLLEFQKKTNRRRETRRHTLQNGIDYNMLKRIRHLEEEKDLLLDGLHAVENTQEWYFKQIAFVQEKMKSLSRGDTHLEQWSEAYEERLDLQRARIMEVNRCLASLEDSWERGGLPMHMNLAVRNHNYAYNNNNGDIAQFHDVQLNQLKTQNRQLTDEVSQKSERITALEVERKTLIREIVQHQQQKQLLCKQGHYLCGNEEVIF